MFYIPDEWLVDKKNGNRIYELLTSANSDFFLVGENPFNDLMVELEEMGETIIIDKIKDGTIVFG